MKLNHIIKPCIVLILCLMISTQAAFADGIKERMLQRLPIIADLKSKGIIGEDNKGYLGFVTAQRVQEAVVEAENTDRKTVYALFAKQQNTTIDVVEKVQAARKMEKASPGDYVQNPDGSWVKK